MVLGSSPEARSTCNKIPGCKNSEKCDGTKFEGDRLQDGRASFAMRGFHHEDVVSTSNLKMIMGPALHSLVQFEAHKTWPCVTP